MIPRPRAGLHACAYLRAAKNQRGFAGLRAWRLHIGPGNRAADCAVVMRWRLVFPSRDSGTLSGCDDAECAGPGVARLRAQPLANIRHPFRVRPPATRTRRWSIPKGWQRVAGGAKRSERPPEPHAPRKDAPRRGAAGVRASSLPGPGVPRPDAAGISPGCDRARRAAGTARATVLGMSFPRMSRHINVPRGAVCCALLAALLEGRT
jgi:hypothetical protein